MKNMGERRKAKQRRGRYITTGLTYIEGVFRVKTLDFFISFSSSRVNPAALMQCEHRITFTSTVTSHIFRGLVGWRGTMRCRASLGTLGDVGSPHRGHFQKSITCRSAVARRRLKGARHDAKLEEDVADAIIMMTRGVVPCARN